jgi:hypothetical protein
MEVHDFSDKSRILPDSQKAIGSSGENKELFQIGRENFDPKRAPEDVNKALNNMVQKLLPEGFSRDNKMTNLVRYEIERCCNQLALANCNNVSMSRYLRLAPDAYPEGLLSVSSDWAAHDKEVRFKIFREGNTLKLLMTNYRLIQDMNIGTKKSMTRVGYDAVQVEIAIDFSKMTSQKLLLSEGCMSVVERIAGFQRYRWAVTFEKSKG